MSVAHFEDQRRDVRARCFTGGAPFSSNLAISGLTKSGRIQYPTRELPALAFGHQESGKAMRWRQSAIPLWSLRFTAATPILSKSFRCIDFDMRGYGQSERPLQHYSMEVWALAGLEECLDGVT